MNEFDNKTIEKLGFYVYGLIDPDTDKIFYIGKGTGNRVFMHVKDAIEGDESSLKLNKIRDILSQNKIVNHIILRSGLKENEAFEIESTLIDYVNYFNNGSLNAVSGKHSDDRGIMRTDEIIRKYNAKDLREFHHPLICININQNYKRGISKGDIYKSTKEAWRVDQNKIKHITIALAEFQGIIIEVFKINKWYKVDIKEFNKKNKMQLNEKGDRWGFEGEVADNITKSIYINKSIAWCKRKGAAGSIRYRLDKPNPHLEELLKENKKKSVKTKKITYDGMKIGQYVRKLFLRLNEEKKLSKNEIIKLQDLDYCKRIFNAGFPVLIKNTISKEDHLGEVRYYKDEYVKGYWLSSQWVEKQFERLRKWEKEIRTENSK